MTTLKDPDWKDMFLRFFSAVLIETNVCISESDFGLTAEEQDKVIQAYKEFTDDGQKETA